MNCYFFNAEERKGSRGGTQRFIRVVVLQIGMFF